MNDITTPFSPLSALNGCLVLEFSRVVDGEKHNLFSVNTFNMNNDLFFIRSRQLPMNTMFAVLLDGNDFIRDNNNNDTN